MASRFRCSKCDSILFEQIQPQIFDSNGIRVWGANTKIVPEHTNVTIIKCICCNYITIPACSLIGKNALDLDVQILKELYDAVEKHNKSLSNENESLKEDINNIKNSITVMYDKMNSNITKKFTKTNKVKKDE